MKSSFVLLAEGQIVWDRQRFLMFILISKFLYHLLLLCCQLPTHSVVQPTMESCEELMGPLPVTNLPELALFPSLAACCLKLKLHNNKLLYWKTMVVFQFGLLVKLKSLEIGYRLNFWLTSFLCESAAVIINFCLNTEVANQSDHAAQHLKTFYGILCDFDHQPLALKSPRLMWQSQEVNKKGRLSGPSK